MTAAAWHCPPTAASAWLPPLAAAASASRCLWAMKISNGFNCTQRLMLPECCLEQYAIDSVKSLRQKSLLSSLDTCSCDSCCLALPPTVPRPSASVPATSGCCCCFLRHAAIHARAFSTSDGYISGSAGRGICSCRHCGPACCCRLPCPPSSNPLPRLPHVFWHTCFTAACCRWGCGSCAASGGGWCAAAVIVACGLRAPHGRQQRAHDGMHAGCRAQGGREQAPEAGGGEQGWR